MAFFGIGKKKKEEDVISPLSPPMGSPKERIPEMKDQGMSEGQITQNLQKEGFTPEQTFSAMSQSEMRPASEIPEQTPSEPPIYDQGTTEDRIEEIAEAIIDEKWNELVRNINKIVDWKDKTEARIGQLEQKFKDLKTDFENLHSGVLGKVSEYDQNLLNIGSEIKAMEKVFQKVLPSFTENVNELSRLTKSLKKNK